jgi:large subunit ribosomal protein L29
MGRATELRGFDDEELESRLAEQRKELFNLRFQLATGRLDNVTRIGEVRRQIARILTVQRDRDLSLGSGLDDQGRGDRR